MITFRLEVLTLLNLQANLKVKPTRHHREIRLCMPMEQ